MLHSTIGMHYQVLFTVKNKKNGDNLKEMSSPIFCENIIIIFLYKIVKPTEC